MTNPSLPLVHELIRSACSAPSVHNTQPWSWRVLDLTTIELYADRGRQLRATDPRGRDLTISCGAALHHLVVAAEAFGVAAEVVLVPAKQAEDLLARIHLTPGHTDGRAVEMLAALENRVSDRRGFSTWEVPSARVLNLCEAATRWGAHALPLTDPLVRHRTEALLEQARGIQAADPRITAEQRAWTDRLDPGSVEGIHTTNAVPPRRPGTTHRPDRFDRPAASPSDTDENTAPEPEPTDCLVAICTERDDLRAWLQAGQAMSAVWLQATLGGLALTAESQVIEVESTRRLLQREVFSYTGRVQVLLRIGWPEATRPPLPRTPRRSLEDVLRS